MEYSLHFGNYNVEDVGVPIIMNFMDACIETVWLGVMQQLNASSINTCNSRFGCIVNGNISFLDAFSSHEKCLEIGNYIPNRLYEALLEGLSTSQITGRSVARSLSSCRPP